MGYFNTCIVLAHQLHLLCSEHKVLSYFCVPSVEQHNCKIGLSKCIPFRSMRNTRISPTWSTILDKQVVFGTYDSGMESVNHGIERHSRAYEPCKSYCWRRRDSNCQTVFTSNTNQVLPSAKVIIPLIWTLIKVSSSETSEQFIVTPRSSPSYSILICPFTDGGLMELGLLRALGIDELGCQVL